jgi:hypothetical protein
MKRKPLISPTYVKALREQSAYKSNRETSKAAISFCRGIILAGGTLLSISLLVMMITAGNGAGRIMLFIVAGIVVLILLFIAWVALNNWFEKINMEFDNADNQFVISQLTYESMTQTLFEDSGLPDEPVRKKDGPALTEEELKAPEEKTLWERYTEWDDPNQPNPK